MRALRSTWTEWVGVREMRGMGPMAEGVMLWVDREIVKFEGSNEGEGLNYLRYTHKVNILRQALPARCEGQVERRQTEVLNELPAVQLLFPLDPTSSIVSPLVSTTTGKQSNSLHKTLGNRIGYFLPPFKSTTAKSLALPGLLSANLFAPLELECDLSENPHANSLYSEARE